MTVTMHPQPTVAGPLGRDAVIEKAAKRIAVDSEYRVDRIMRVLVSDRADAEWLVLFLGRYRGEGTGAGYPCSVWVRLDGSGYVEPGF